MQFLSLLLLSVGKGEKSGFCCIGTVVLLFYRQWFYCLSFFENQKFLRGQSFMEESENFYSVGKTIVQRGSFLEVSFQLAPLKIWQNLM